MPTTYLTLEYAGSERSMASWGFTDPTLDIGNQGRSTFSVKKPGAVTVSVTEAALPIPWGGDVIVRRNRSSAAGVDNTFSGGEVIFKGGQRTRRGSASPEDPEDGYTFVDAWWELENLTFQQQWTSGTPPQGNTNFSRLNLFQDYTLYTVTAATNNADGVSTDITIGSAFTTTVGMYVQFRNVAGLSSAKVTNVTSTTIFRVLGRLSTSYASGGSMFPGLALTNGQQIQQIIEWAITCGVAIQVGTIDLGMYLPIYPVRGVTCASAIQICLQPTPDAETWLDYTYSPPKFNCRQRGNLNDIYMPYAGGGHQSSEIVPRYDLQVPGVVIQYVKTSTNNGLTYTDFGSDVYPALTTGQVPGTLVVPVDLRGGARTDVFQSVTADINLVLTTLTWWLRKKPELQKWYDPSNHAGGPGNPVLDTGSIVVKTDAGVDITSTWASNYPRELLKGDITGWMFAAGVSAVPVTITAQFKYDELDTDGRKWHSAKEHSVSVRVKLTNSPAGLVTYSALATLDPGESAPPGLAQALYDSLSVLSYEGTHVIMDEAFKTTAAIPGPQFRLNLTGGSADWTAMRATIQGVRIDFFRNTCEITFGPPKHIAPGDLEQLMMFYRWRSVYENPALRLNGQTSAMSTQIGGDTAAENSTHAKSPDVVHTTAAPAPDPGGGSPGTTWIQHDAPNQQIVGYVVDSAAAPVSGQPSFKAALADLTDATNKDVAFRWFYFKDSKSSCAAKKFKYWGTEPEADV